MRMWKRISPKQLWQTVSCAEIFSSSKSNQLHFPDPGVPPIKILRWLGQTDGVFVAFRQMLLNSKIDECFHIYKWSFSGGPTTINFPISKWTFFQGMYSPFRTEIKDPGLDSSQNINYGSIWKAFETAKHFFHCHPFIHSVVSTMSGFLGGESTTWIPEMVLVPPSSTRFPNRPLVSSGQWWPACRALIGREPPHSGFWLVRPVVCWSGLTTRRSPLVSSDQPAGQTCPPETFPNPHPLSPPPPPTSTYPWPLTLHLFLSFCCFVITLCHIRNIYAVCRSFVVIFISYIIYYPLFIPDICHFFYTGKIFGE